MTKSYIILIFFFIMISSLLYISGCDKSVENQGLDLSTITATGTQGPQDFIGSIDLSDWSPSNYNSVVFGTSFWIQRPALSDTMFFGGRLAGDTVSLSLKIYNWSSTPLVSRLHLQSPFYLDSDSVQIQPSSLETISIHFILPDTTNIVHNNMLILQFSTGHSVLLKLQGYHVPSGSGGPIESHLPNSFSLAPAYPNPTDGEISFSFAVPQIVDAVFKVVNNKNEVVATIAQGNYLRGFYQISWNANLENGNYRAVFQAGGYTAQGDIQILK